ncbi:hypothetical protein K438DRAFT_1979233 [Mycena galopus ATCC 62051]|nr:hypothetical protein K438DRAFT_1979233 [Mycena galopus ATCC 62051]
MAPCVECGHELLIPMFDAEEAGAPVHVHWQQSLSQRKADYYALTVDNITTVPFFIACEFYKNSTKANAHHVTKVCELVDGYLVWLVFLVGVDNEAELAFSVLLAILQLVVDFHLVALWNQTCNNENDGTVDERWNHRFMETALGSAGAEKAKKMAEAMGCGGMVDSINEIAQSDPEFAKYPIYDVSFGRPHPIHLIFLVPTGSNQPLIGRNPARPTLLAKVSCPWRENWDINVVRKVAAGFLLHVERLAYIALRLMYKFLCFLSSTQGRLVPLLALGDTPSAPQRAHALAWPKADPDPFRASVRPLNSVLFAVTNTGTKLRMGNLGYHFFLQDPEVLEKFAPTLSSLEKLVIQLKTPFNLGLRNEDERNLLVEPFANQHIPDLLRQAVNLRDLTVILPGRGEQGRIPLSGILGNADTAPYWPYLCRLRLEWWSTDEEYLESFLLRQALTLEFPRLADVDFGSQGGDWPSAFTRLAGKLPRLAELWLRGNFEEAETEHRGVYRFPGTGNMCMPGGDLMREVEDFLPHLCANGASANEGNRSFKVAR